MGESRRMVPHVIFCRVATLVHGWTRSMKYRILLRRSEPIHSAHQWRTGTIRNKMLCIRWERNHRRSHSIHRVHRCPWLFHQEILKTRVRLTRIRFCSVGRTFHRLIVVADLGLVNLARESVLEHLLRTNRSVPVLGPAVSVRAVRIYTVDKKKALWDVRSPGASHYLSLVGWLAFASSLSSRLWRRSQFGSEY